MHDLDPITAILVAKQAAERGQKWGFDTLSAYALDTSQPIRQAAEQALRAASNEAPDEPKEAP